MIGVVVNGRLMRRHKLLRKARETARNCAAGSKVFLIELYKSGGYRGMIGATYPALGSKIKIGPCHNKYPINPKEIG